MVVIIGTQRGGATTESVESSDVGERDDEWSDGCPPANRGLQIRRTSGRDQWACTGSRVLPSCSRLIRVVGAAQLVLSLSSSGGSR
jgi:hypothetical protein